jgi:leucyl aminopeptidase
LTLLTPLRGDLSGQKADLSVHFQFHGDSEPTTVSDPSLRAALSEVAKLDGFEGKSDASLLWHSNGKFPASRFLVLGLGDRKTFGRETLFRACAAAGSRAVGLQAKTVGIALAPGAWRLAPEACAEITAGAFLHGCYRFDKYLTTRKAGAQPSELILGMGRANSPRIRKTLEEVRSIDRAIRLARDLVSEHPGFLHPMRMAEVAVAEAKRAGVKCKLVKKPELKRLGMGGMLGVGRGSERPPVLIHLHHRGRPQARAKARIVLVGKGVTFDTGGISLKQADGMEAMKADMSGAAAVLATLLVLPALRVPVEVHGLLMMVENMPDGNAFRPGDILRLFNGKTAEIKSTDAEGRLILADGLSWACKVLKPDYLVDLATLTGACMVALGPGCTGVMSNHSQFARRILRAAHLAGEKMWELPLFPEYREHIRSDVADVKNAGIRYGGAITAGLFLQEFVEPSVKWAHLDIAGPAYFEAGYGYAAKGATGHGVRTMLELIRSLA